MANPRNRLYQKDEFIKRYNELKTDNVMEKEIAEKMFLAYDTMYRYKKQYGVGINTAWRYKRAFEKEPFIEKYNQLKNEGLMEKEIAVKMGLTKHTLYRYKKEYGVPIITPETKELTNQNGLTKNMLKVAKENGLDSSVVNARIREHNWSVEDACTQPPLEKGVKIMKKGERKNAN